VNEKRLFLLVGSSTVARLARPFVRIDIEHQGARETATTSKEAESRESIEVLKRKFAEICDPRGNVIMERHKFNTRIQKEGE